MSDDPLASSKKRRLRWVVAATLIVVMLALSNPGKEKHFAAMRESAKWDAPYSIDEQKLQAAGFEYESYALFSVMRLSDGVYTWGALMWVSATDRLQPKLITLAKE